MIEDNWLCAKTVDFDFWGSSVRVGAHAEEDIAHLEHYFRDYRVRLDSPMRDVMLMATSGKFCASTSPNRTVWTRQEGEHWVLWDDLGTFERRPSLLPPLNLPPLSLKFRSYHAAAVVHPGSNLATIIVGSSGAGKSSLLLTLVERGWTFVTDDVLIVDDKKQLIPFSRPIGMRGATLRRLSHGTQRPSGIEFTTPTGTTTAVHPADLGLRLPQTPVDWRTVVSISRATQFSALRPAARHLQLRGDVDSDFQRLQMVLAAEQLAGDET